MNYLNKSKELVKLREFGVLLVLFALVVVLAITTTTFLTAGNIINVMRQAVEIGIMAIGMTYVIVSAEIDLSVGSIFGVTAMLGAMILRTGAPPTLAFIAAIGAGLAIGMFNGILTAKAGMPAFIVTLGTMLFFRSAAFAISGGMSIGNFPAGSMGSWVFTMGTNIGPIPIQVIIMLVVYVIAAVVMKKTKFGFETYATGGNHRAAMLGGINVDRVKITCFMISGGVSALAGMISISFLRSVPTTAGAGREMDVIAAVILGGAALSGGRGSVIGTFLGAIMMSVIRNGMVLWRVPAFWQSGSIGVVIILAVLLDKIISRSSEKR